MNWQQWVSFVAACFVIWLAYRAGQESRKPPEFDAIAYKQGRADGYHEGYSAGLADGRLRREVAEQIG